MPTIALKLCSNGGLKLDVDGLVLGCCDPCEIAISQERERILSLPYLLSFQQYGEGLMYYENLFDEQGERKYACKAVFEYSYKENENSEYENYVLEYFDCTNCERIVLFNFTDRYYSMRFYTLPNACNGCVVKVKNPTLLATIDESGAHEDTYENFIYRLVWSYTNNTALPQMVFWVAGGNVAPNNRFIDNWAQLLKNGEVPTVEGVNIYNIIVYPNETVDLYDINESHNTEYNPWEIHCKVYLAEIICDPCEVKMYNEMYETAADVSARYGAGFFTGGGAHAPYKGAFVTVWNDDYFELYGFTCDTCEKVHLGSYNYWDEDWDGVIPFVEDATACDGEGEVQ